MFNCMCMVVSIVCVCLCMYVVLVYDALCLYLCIVHDVVCFLYRALSLRGERCCVIGLVCNQS